MKLNANQIIALRALAAFGTDGSFWPAKEIKPFEKLGAVESAPDTTDADGNIAVRVSEAGSQYLADLEPAGNDSNKGVDGGNGSVDNANQAGNTAAPTRKPEEGRTVTKFVIESNVNIPTVSARAASSQYPFDQLEVGQSFFVPATEDKPNPAKSLASTVASANARWAEEIQGETRTNRKGNVVPATKQVRNFIVRTMSNGDVEGARVFRDL